jgi:hypothetical protein
MFCATAAGAAASNSTAIRGRQGRMGGMFIMTSILHRRRHESVWVRQPGSEWFTAGNRRRTGGFGGGIPALSGCGDLLRHIPHAARFCALSTWLPLLLYPRCERASARDGRS